MKHDDDSADEPQPTAQERAEAEELARALEPDAPAARAAAAPEDALAVAALLRQARRAQAPESAARERERLAAAETRALPVTAARPPRRRRWLWPALLAPLAVAAGWMLMLQTRSPAPHLTGGTPPPAPPLALLQAQARAVRERADLAALDRQMRDYRAAYYAALAGGDPEGP